MKNKNQIIILLIATALIAALTAGCGSSGSSSSSSTSSAGQTEASAEFIKPGSKSKIPKFGQEASATERETASAILESNLQARAAGDWAAQCSSLSAAAIKKIEEGPGVGAEGNCTKDLETQAQPISATKTIRANTMTGPIAALRVEGDKAFALYHGTKGVDYAMPMTKEGGTWKVASLVTQELP